jgi:hypothetical protein
VIKNLLIALAGLIVVGFVWTSWKAYDSDHTNTGGTPCTLEAKICPDGTAVGRVSPSCEFSECPTATSTPPVTTGAGTVAGTVLYGPTCPVMRDPPDPRCADKPYAADLVLTTADGLKSIQTFRSDIDGSFTLSIEPGSYAIHGAPSGKAFPRCNSEVFQVVKDKTAAVTVQCDSGIR